MRQVWDCLLRTNLRPIRFQAPGGKNNNFLHALRIFTSLSGVSFWISFQKSSCVVLIVWMHFFWFSPNAPNPFFTASCKKEQLSENHGFCWVSEVDSSWRPMIFFPRPFFLRFDMIDLNKNLTQLQNLPETWHFILLLVNKDLACERIPPKTATG